MTGFGEFPADEFGGNMTGDFGFGNATDEFGGNATDTGNNLTGVVLGN
jgi:hypothetical protein